MDRAFLDFSFFRYNCCTSSLLSDLPYAVVTFSFTTIIAANVYAFTRHNALQRAFTFLTYTRGALNCQSEGAGDCETTTFLLVHIRYVHLRARRT